MSTNLIPVNYSEFTPAERRGGILRAVGGAPSVYEAAQVEHERALLAKTAMTNAAALSALEETLAENIPSSRQRVKHIADAYTWSAAIKVAKW